MPEEGSCCKKWPRCTAHLGFKKVALRLLSVGSADASKVQLRVVLSVLRRRCRTPTGHRSVRVLRVYSVGPPIIVKEEERGRGEYGC